MSTNTLKQALEIVYGDIKNINKRVKNLESASIGVLYTETTKSAVAYQDNVSANACPYALLNKVGGMSYKSENLLVLSDVAETTINGITYKVENGVITINGTARANFNLGFAFDSVDTGTYSMSLFPTGTMSATNPWGVGESIGTLDFTISNTINNITTNIDIKYLWRYISSGQTFNNYQIKPMLVSGSTAPTEYRPYFEGIRDTAITSVISKDSNDTALQTLNIPNEIQALEGYGWGINDTCYNYIDFDRKKFIQKVGTRAYQSGDEEDTSVLTDLTTTYYELETPVETNISQYIDDNSIQIEANGTITFDNQYQQAIPYEYLFLEKVGANNE